MNEPPESSTARPAAPRIRPPAGARRGRLPRRRRQPAGLCAHPRLSRTGRAADAAAGAGEVREVASGAHLRRPRRGRRCRRRRRSRQLARAGGDAPLVIEDVDRRGYDEAALFHLLNQSMRDRPAAADDGARADRATGRTGPMICCRGRGSRRCSRVALSRRHPIVTDVREAVRRPAGDGRSKDHRLSRRRAWSARPRRPLSLAELIDRLALARGTAITRVGCGRSAGAARGVDAARTRPGRRRR